MQRSTSMADRLALHTWTLDTTPPENVPRPQDRLAPGQGVVRIHDFFGLLREKGYQGYLSYEAPIPATWARDPSVVLSEALEATREIIAEVEAGA
ncbi:MAG: sugar phosphate isomerase/epimerase [Chloroflexi bacterium]|nr:sugar phosphate isomerase/epimerase [Chloroflexota bacterium]